MFGFSLAFTSPPFRPSPALQLYFAGATTLDSRITFTRADAVTCATYFDSTGRMQRMGANLLTWSQDFSNVAYSGTGVVWANAGIVDPLGGTSGGTITASLADSNASRSFTPTTSTTYTFSVWLKTPSGTNTVNIYLNGGGTLASTVCNVTTTWQRFSVTGTTTSTAAMLEQIGGSGTLSTGEVLHVFGMQLELGSTATTYSATTTAANSGPRFDYDPASPAGVTGPELVTNGDFSQGFTGWSAIAGGWSIADGVATLTGNGAPQDLQQNVVTATGKTYLLSYNVISSTGTMLLTADGNTVASGSSGTISGYYRATGTSITLVAKRQSGTVNAVIDNVSVKEVTFNPRGLLIEESRQNLLSQSNAWNNNGGASVATSTQNAVGIDGGATSAWTITESATSGNQYSVSSVGVITAAVHTVSAFVKAGTKNIVQLCVPSVLSTDYANFTLSGDGTVNQATTLANCSIRNVGGGWYRIAMTFTAAAGSGGAVVTMINATTDVRLPVYTGTSKTVIVFGAQIELGSFPTSYIVTTGTALTRAADSASMTGTNFSSWFNASAGTFVVDVGVLVSGVDVRAMTAYSGANEVSLRRTSGNVVSIVLRDGGTRDINLSGTFTTGLIKIAATYTTNDTAGSYNAGTVGTGVVYTPQTLATLAIGENAAAGSKLNGHIRSLRYYPTRLANATLQALTA